MNALEVTGLCKKYPKFTLDNVSFSVGEGARVRSDRQKRRG